jgi:hypothetical protein
VHTNHKSDLRASFSGNKREAREVQAAICEPSSLVESGRLEWENLSRDWNCGEDLLRSGSASLVAVVKSANLRYGNHGSECRRVHRPWFRCVLGQ